MLIGQVATEADVNVQTLRYYERRGLLARPSRTRAGYRRYPEETVRVVRFIKRAQDLGFTLKEIRELLRLRSDRRQNRDQMRTIAEAKILDVDARMRDLRRIRRALATLQESCECSSRTLDCPILEALESDAPARSRTSNGGRKKMRETP